MLPVLLYLFAMYNGKNMAVVKFLQLLLVTLTYIRIDIRNYICGRKTVSFISGSLLQQNFLVIFFLLYFLDEIAFLFTSEFKNLHFDNRSIRNIEYVNNVTHLCSAELIKKLQQIKLIGVIVL